MRLKPRHLTPRRQPHNPRPNLFHTEPYRPNLKLYSIDLKLHLINLELYSIDLELYLIDIEIYSIDLNVYSIDLELYKLRFSLRSLNLESYRLRPYSNLRLSTADDWRG